MASRHAGALAVLAALGGCGGDGEARRAGAAAQEAAVKRVLAQAADALYAGDGARACSLYTPAFRRAFVRANQANRSELAPKGATCAEQVRSYAPILRRIAPSRDLRVIQVSVSGSTATAVSELTTARGKTRVTEFLVRQAGQWKINADQRAGEPPPPAATATD